MAKLFGKKRRLVAPPNRAVRNMLRNFEARNAAEARNPSWSTIERQVRELLQRECPHLGPAEIERRVARRIEHGRRPH